MNRFFFRAFATKPLLTRTSLRVLLWASSLVTLAAGCASSNPHSVTGDAEPELRLQETRIIAIAGQTLVIPVAPVGGLDPAGKNVRIELDDGRRLKAELHRFSASTQNDPNVWLTHSRRWWSGTGDSNGDSPQQPAPDFIMDAVVVELPDDSTGRAVRIADHPLDIAWRAKPNSPHGLYADAPTSAELGDPKTRINLFASLAPALEDPLIRWRCRLLADRLRSADYPVLADRIDQVHFDSVALEALANQIELRWRLALDRLHRADPATARRVAQSLTRLVSFDELHVLPAWSSPVNDPNSTGLERLLADLLDDNLDDHAVAARAQVWLTLEPKAVAWVIDDAGAANPQAGFALVRIGVSNMTGSGRIARAQLLEDRPGPRFSLAPAGSATVVASAPLDTPVSSAAIQVGDWNRQLTVVANPVNAKPPGVRLSPFFEPWSLTSWRLGSPVVATPDRATAALWQRRTDGSWELYIECRTLSGASPPPGDSVRIWLGPTGRPSAIIRIDALGFTIDESVQHADAQEEHAARKPIAITKLEDRWICMFSIPESLIEPGGYIRIGVERRDETGVRSTWPRPVLPWINEPGRALINLNVWMDQ